MSCTLWRPTYLDLLFLGTLLGTPNEADQESQVMAKKKRLGSVRGGSILGSDQDTTHQEICYRGLKTSSARTGATGECYREEFAKPLEPI